LLDTHILIWASVRTLPQEAVPFIANADNILLFSPASIWEIEEITLLTADVTVAGYGRRIIYIKK
jgi:hypothetical protein